jgi:hypothetical protein
VSIITFPAGMYFGGYSIAQKRFDLREMSDSTGDTRDRLMSPPRWRLRISPPSVGMTYDHSDIWTTFLLKLRGGINHLAAYDVVRTRPKGTCAGVITVGSAVAKGDSTAIIAGGTPGTTLLPGDWLQFGSGVGSQYVCIVWPVTFDGLGSILVTFEPPMRAAYGIGISVTYDKPVAHYKMMTDAPEWGYMPGAYLVNGFSLDFLEVWN